MKRPLTVAGTTNSTNWILRALEIREVTGFGSVDRRGGRPLQGWDVMRSMADFGDSESHLSVHMTDGRKVI